jgi:hypothetical protein
MPLHCNFGATLALLGIHSGQYSTLCTYVIALANTYAEKKSVELKGTLYDAYSNAWPFCKQVSHFSTIEMNNCYIGTFSCSSCQVSNREGSINNSKDASYEAGGWELV